MYDAQVSLELKDQIRSGVRRWKTVLAGSATSSLARLEPAGVNCGASSVTMAAFNSSRPIVVGRADSRAGQLSFEEAAIAVPAEAGSCVGQCVSADAGARQVAPHHARAGPAVPINMATITTASRCTRPV